MIHNTRGYIYFPRALRQVFRLLSGSEEHYLAAGLKLPVLLQYTPGGQAGMHCGELQVYVDDRLTLRVPVEA